MSIPNRTPYSQTDMDTHLLWAKLGAVDKFASVVIHVLIAHMERDCDPAVVIPQKLLAKLSGCSVRTVQRVLGRLEKEKWIQQINLGKGTACAYRVNSRAGWLDSRSGEEITHFRAVIVAARSDQKNMDEGALVDIRHMVDGNVMPFPKRKKTETTTAEPAPEHAAL